MLVLSKDESSEAGGGGEERGAGKTSGSTGGHGRLRNSGVTSGGRGDSRGRSIADGRLLSGGLARNLNSGVLDRGKNSSVALGDGGGRVGRNADSRLRSWDRLLRDMSRHLGHLRNFGNVGLLGNLWQLGVLSGHLRDVSLLRNFWVLSWVLRNLGGMLRDLGGMLGDLCGVLRDFGVLGNLGRLLDGADSGGHSNGLSGDDSAVLRAVRHLGRAGSHSVDRRGVNGRGGQGDGAGSHSGGVRGAVSDSRAAVSDGDQLGGIVGDGRVRRGHGTRGQDGGSDGETHFEDWGWFEKELKFFFLWNEWLSVGFAFGINEC